MDSKMFMAPVAQQPVHEVVRERSGSGRKATEASFSQYMEEKMRTERKEKQNMVGVERAEKMKKKPTPEKMEPESAGETEAGFLKNIIQKLKEVAEGTGLEVGQWVLTEADIGLLEKIAAEAGMDVSQLAFLLQQMEENSGELDLIDFFAALTEHFEKMDNPAPITVPDTDLPFFETLLSQMGVPPEAIRQLADMAVTGEDQLDLTLLFDGLEEIEAEGFAALSDWDMEEFSNILSKAGVSREVIQSLLGDKQDGQKLNLAGLRDILAKGITDVEVNRPQVDISAFADDLDTLLAQAGFKDASAGFTPVVQESLKAIYEELQKLVDMSKVRVEKVNHALDEEMWLDEQADMDFDLWTQMRQEGKAGSDPGSQGGQSGGRHEFVPQLFQFAETPPAAYMNTPLEMPDESAKAVDVPRAAMPGFRMAAALQQQAADQITMGVIRGLQNNDHHLILRLNPPELGKVKVDMLIRNDQISVTFAMENSKVKEALESHMQQFKESLEQRGFVLDQCFVSVDRDNDAEDAWQRFEFERNSLGIRRETLSELPEEALYHRAAAEKYPESNVNIFV